MPQAGIEPTTYRLGGGCSVLLSYWGAPSNTWLAGNYSIFNSSPRKSFIISPMDETWRNELNAEFAQAALARSKGNEGQARVCARRAAGIAIRQYLLRRGERVPSPSAYDLLQIIEADSALPEEIRRAAGLLRLRVTEAFTLPVDADLIEEARRLCAALLPDWGD